MPRSTASGGAELTGGWAPRRFWTSARAEPVPGGFTVFLDARPLRTPAKAPLIVPTRALAEAIAAEWNAQGKTIDPHAMPLTRYANSAIDKVGPQFAEVAALVGEEGLSLQALATAMNMATTPDAPSKRLTGSTQSARRT